MCINGHDEKTAMVVGSGGRCHAIADALTRSARVRKVICAPGNPGMASMGGKIECVPSAGVTDVETLVSLARDRGVDLVVIGPEASLAAGLADALHEAGIAVFGPTRSGARIESSKEFAKELMEKYGIPTAAYRSFDGYEEARDYVMGRPLPAVIKYDGLAAGKGVVVAATYEEADAALRDMLLDNTFGKGRVVVEDFLEGPEFSFMCAVSGRKVYPLAIAQDHKRAYEGDKGPNTGGMGAYSPVPFVTPEIEKTALETIMQPTADALADEGIDYVGVLYGGLILTSQGPKVIEFNARFGDPETEVVLPRMQSDIYSLFEAAVRGEDFETEWSGQACLGIVLAAQGYPGSYVKDIPLGDLKSDMTIYHMGTRKGADGQFISGGGRVLMVVGFGDNLDEARRRALAETERLANEKLFWRSDIGYQSCH